MRSPWKDPIHKIEKRLMLLSLLVIFTLAVAILTVRL